MSMFRYLCPLSLIVLLASFSLPASASDNAYLGPVLKADDDGQVLVDNSHYRYTAQDRLEFFTEPFLKQEMPELLPLRPAIDTWASRHNVHPKVLSWVVRDYFVGRQVLGHKSELAEVAQLAAAIDTVFQRQDGHPLAATRAIKAVADGLAFELRLPEDLAVARQSVTSLGGNPTLFDYFQPPWQIGETWAGGGAHGDTGNGLQNALDFIGEFVSWGEDTSAWWVAAMQSGTVRVWSSCGMSVIHDDGWVTDYYHLDNIQFSDMQSVERNIRLSNYADNLAQATCAGGAASGPHVHMSVSWNGNRVLVDESEIDFTAFSHHVGNGQYDSNCATSWYTHFNNGQVCPFFRQLLNDSPSPAGFIFTDGFESGDMSAWSQ